MNIGVHVSFWIIKLLFLFEIQKLTAGVLSDNPRCGGQPPPPLRINMLKYYAYITLYIFAFVSASPYLPNSSTVLSGTYYLQPAKAPVLSTFLFNFLSLLKSDSPLRTLFSCCPLYSQVPQTYSFGVFGVTNVLKSEISKNYNWCFQWKATRSLEQTSPGYLILAFYGFWGILWFM